jgi:cytochrome P450
VYSSNIVGVLIGKRRGGQANLDALSKSGHGGTRNTGMDPVDVLAIQDPPAHTYQRALSQGHLSFRYVKSLEEDVHALAAELLAPLSQRGHMEFMDAVAWRLPMTMALRLVGFPESDYPEVKKNCSAAIGLLSGLSTPGEFAANSAAGLRLYRYCWREYLKIRRNPQNNLTHTLIKAVDDPANPMTDEEAVSIILQILIAGSDSSASTMGNAVKMLIENPEIEQRLRREPERIGDFVEEVLRLESAFQGHFRITKQDTILHGVALPKGTRLFLMWASANRDERFWQNPDVIDIDREKLKLHVTFGYGPHSCLGRELARMEIRIVLAELLRRTQSLSIVGPTPRVASLFVRTLVRLPIAFVPATSENPAIGHVSSTGSRPVSAERCPFGHGP